MYMYSNSNDAVADALLNLSVISRAFDFDRISRFTFNNFDSLIINNWVRMWIYIAKEKPRMQLFETFQSKLNFIHSTCTFYMFHLSQDIFRNELILKCF